MKAWYSLAILSKYKLFNNDMRFKSAEENIGKHRIGDRPER
jgi:hypothetical protein